VQVQPFEEPLLQKLEIMNEIVAVITIDVLFNMTPESRSRYAMEVLGWMFVLCIFANLSIHMTFIVKNGFYDAK
jgi:hypothetical protein